MRARMLYKLLVLQFPLRAVKSGCRIPPRTTGKEARTSPLQENFWLRPHQSTDFQEDWSFWTADYRNQLWRQHFAYYQECADHILPERARPNIQDIHWAGIPTRHHCRLRRSGPHRQGRPTWLIKLGRMKQADTDNLAYNKSKTKFYGVNSSMTTKEVDEKLSVHRSTIESEPMLSAASATASTRVTSASRPSRDKAFLNCPLSHWNAKYTKTAGNKRIDQDKITVDFATIRQRTNLSIRRQNKDTTVMNRTIPWLRKSKGRRSCCNNEVRLLRIALRSKKASNDVDRLWS